MLVVDVLDRGTELEAGLAYQAVLFPVLPGLELPVQQQFQALGERQFCSPSNRPAPVRPLLALPRGVDDTAKDDIPRRALGAVFRPGGQSVAVAPRLVTEVRAAPHHALLAHVGTGRVRRAR